MASESAAEAEEGARWQYRQDTYWRPYDTTSSDTVEAAYIAGEKQGTFELRGTMYIFDLHRFTQLNTMTEFERNIRRIPAATKDVDPTRPIWEYRENDEWLSVDLESQKRLEEAYATYPMPTATECSFVNRRTGNQQLYKYNLVNLVQTNASTGFQRNVRRVPAYSPAVGQVPSVEWEAFTMGEDPLASGSFKAVYKAQWSGDGGGKEVAVLVLRKQNGECPRAAEEIAMFGRLGRHPNLVQLLATTRKPSGEHAMVLEFASRGSLHDVLLQQLDSGGDPLAEVVLLTIAMQVCHGMQTLHSQGIVHRDIAARNVLVFACSPTDRKQVCVKICDYGLSVATAGTTITTNAQGIAGPTRWMAPESLQFRRYSTKSDVWACGVLFWEMWNGGAIPYFWVNENPEVSVGVVNGALRLPQPERCSGAAWAVVERCFASSAAARPDLHAVRSGFEDVLLAAVGQDAARRAVEAGKECVVCFSEEAAVAFDPCGHKCVCPDCAPPLATCPLCRVPIQAWLRIYD